MFNVPQFARSSQDRFFLCIEATDPQFDLVATAAFLAALGPQGQVIVVPTHGDKSGANEEPSKEEPNA